MRWPICRLASPSPGEGQQSQILVRPLYARHADITGKGENAHEPAKIARRNGPAHYRLAPVTGGGGLPAAAAIFSRRGSGAAGQPGAAERVGHRTVLLSVLLLSASPAVTALPAAPPAVTALPAAPPLAAALPAAPPLAAALPAAPPLAAALPAAPPLATTRRGGAPAAGTVTPAARAAR